MNPIQRLRRVATVVAGLTAALVAFATPAFAAMGPGQGGPASHAVPPPAGPPVIQVHTVAVGGMAGWQIALIAIAAALLAATAAVLVERARTARRRSATAAA